MLVLRLVLALVLIGAGAGCSKKKDSSPAAEKTPGASATGADNGKDPAPGKTSGDAPDDKDGPSAKHRDRGDFKVKYGPGENRELAESLRESQLLESLASEINSVLALPGDIGLEVGDCDEPNAYYDPDEHRILVCYQLIELFEQSFAKLIDDDDELADTVVGATMFTLFHELGHALVHELDLPITGKEEDAVDQLASVVLIAGGDDGAAMALSGADSFLVQAEDDPFAELPFWGEHSLDEQRFYNIVCLVYGADPDAHDQLIESGDLPEERAERCPDEFAQVSRAWQRLLEPHFL